MLILTRRVGENVMIGDNVQVAVLGVKGGQVRVGIEAPQTFHIVREELLMLNQNNKVDVKECGSIKSDNVK